MTNTEKIFDVAIVGGGIAGTVAAWTLRNMGRSVVVVDDHAKASPIFKAERISQETAQTLRQLGLFDRLERISMPLHSTATIKDGAIEEVVANTDYSAPLWKLVAELREGMEDAGIELVVDRAEAASTSEEIQTLQLHSGREIQCRLMVVATGNAVNLLKSLDVEREIISKNHSTTFGFDIEPGDNFKLPTDSVSIRIYKDGADYMNVFATPDGRVRGNLFTYWPTGGERVRNFIKNDTNQQLAELAPRMKEVTGDWRVVGKVQCGSMSVQKSTGFQRPGYVLIGDAYGRICPCLGRGINKALGDVLSLRRHVNRWFDANAPMTWETLSSYYDDPARRELEDHLFKYSLFIRNRLIGKSPIWCLRRWYYDRIPLAAREMVRSLMQKRAPRKMPTAPAAPVAQPLATGFGACSTSQAILVK